LRREEHGDLLVPGPRAVAVALASATDRVIELQVEKDPGRMDLHVPSGIPLRRVDRAQLDRVLDRGVRHGGVVARVRPPACPSLDELAPKTGGDATEAPLLVLDGVTDSRNLGAILRVAAFFGARAVITPARRSAPLTSACCAASAGTACVVPVLRVKNLARALDRLREGGRWIYAADASPGSMPHTTAPRNLPAALVLGDEGSGVRTNVLRRADVRIKINGNPPEGLDSLNVAVASGVLASWLFGPDRALRTPLPGH
jgi:23S rRNA (guanosine2251-2'-O)-methyltransferase